MLVKISNQALDYAWGSKTLISDYFGMPATGKAMAEIWFGTHPGSPTEVSGSARSLAELVEEPLPFLLKILAAEAPLSIQAHPNPEQAKLGFAKENQAGIALSAADRNYKDDKAKPELVVALSESFDALVGFADSRIVAEKLSELLEVSPSHKTRIVIERWLAWLKDSAGIRKVFLDTLTATDVDQDFISELVDLAEQCPTLVDLITHLNAYHGNDRGIASALLLNHMTLAKGQAIFVPAGMPHAYLAGLGVEVMLASDNVLRGGLTPKHIDAQELAEVLVFESTSAELTKTINMAQGLERFDMPTQEFDFYRVEVGPSNLLIDLNLPGAGILLCVSGELALSNSQEERVVIAKGEAAFISGDASTFSITGSGEGFFAVSSN